MADPIDALRPELAKALRLELDEGETLRWCGQPSPDRVFWKAFRAHVLFGIMFFSFGAFAFTPAAMTILEIRDTASAAAGELDMPIGAVVMYACVGLLCFAAAVYFVSRPFAERRGARSTIYALTNTRVFTVLLHDDGRVKAEAVEPGHPLQLIRREHKDGTGDILLYPRGHSGQAGSTVTASMTLVGVSEPRTVERLIRTTFDPPGR